jgi:hypothetical protein
VRPALIHEHQSLGNDLLGHPLRAGLMYSSRSVATRRLGTDPGCGAAEGGGAYRDPPYSLYGVAAMLEGGTSMLLRILQRLCCFLVQLRGTTSDPEILPGGLCSLGA